jgi:hypothetical protein
MRASVGAISIENQHCFCVSKCVIGTIGEGWQWSRAEWRGKIASTGITNGHHMVSGRSRSNPESLVKLHPNMMWLAVSRSVAYGTYTLGHCQTVLVEEVGTSCAIFVHDNPGKESYLLGRFVGPNEVIIGK